jgi:hypothetical protein
MKDNITELNVRIQSLEKEVENLHQQLNEIRLQLETKEMKNN